ncbi:MAG: zinc-ribbon domain-containing protein [Chloroflexi bacterium]|nr:zinc-ribbon domain-containing protein [Chloroflexota bacterium]
MRKVFKRTKSTLINGILLMGLVGMMIVYLIVIGGDVATHVYTAGQYEYLSYNRGRVVSQSAPVWNLLSEAQVVGQDGTVNPLIPDGQTMAAILSGLETRVQADLNARYEEQEGVVVTVYDLDFHSEYHLAYPGPAITTTIELFFPFPSNLETLHEVRFMVDGVEPPEAQYALDGIRWQTEMEIDGEHDIEIGYKADGVNSFTYALNHGRRSDVLDVNITVSGLDGSKVAKSSLPPTKSTADEGSEIFTWDYTHLIPNRDIQVNLPTRLGFAQRVEQLQDDFRTLAGLAPFLVGLFLASLAGLLHLSGTRLTMTTFLLTGFGLVLFYPLLTFLSGLVNLTVAAVAAFLLVSGLLIVFLGLAAGWRQTAGRVGLLLVIFLGIFSLGLLTPWWRLLLTVGGFLLVGAFMLHYARRPVALEPVLEPIITQSPAEESEKETEPEEEPTLTITPSSVEVVPESSHRHCPHCGRELADDHNFCSGCGHDASPFHSCANCGHEQFVPPESGLAHCTHCGQSLEIH